MPREDRRVIFDLSETYQALYKLSLRQEDGKKLMAGAITAISEDPEDKNKIRFVIENPAESQKENVVFTRDFVAAALMMFCRGAGIPLPRKAAKSIMVEKDRVILRAVV